MESNILSAVPMYPILHSMMHQQIIWYDIPFYMFTNLHQYLEPGLVTNGLYTPLTRDFKHLLRYGIYHKIAVS